MNYKGRLIRNGQIIEEIPAQYGTHYKMVLSEMVELRPFWPEDFEQWQQGDLCLTVYENPPNRLFGPVNTPIHYPAIRERLLGLWERLRAIFCLGGD